MKKILIGVIAIFAIVSMMSVDAYAYHGGRGERGGHDRGHYYYRGNHWYRSGAFWTATAVEALIVGAMISSLPPRIQPISINGIQYYTDGTYYYLPASNGGYVVVNPPVVQPVVIQQPVIVQQPIVVRTDNNQHRDK